MRLPQPSRRQGLLAAVAVLGAAIDGTLVELNWIKVVRSVEYFSFPQQPASDLTLVHISDIHIGRFGYRERRAIDIINGADRDLIILSGDLVHGPNHPHELEAFLGTPGTHQRSTRHGMHGRVGLHPAGYGRSFVPPSALFLNLHPSEFNEGWLVRPDDAMFFHEEPVFLEITESVPLSHYRHCHGVLNEVRGRGISLVIDDLGAGYSNLKYIADLAPKVVKLDRQLVVNVHKVTRLHKLVTSLVKLCEAQGAKIVAEGIETIEEMRAVIDSGAHYGQGFLFARPAFPAPKVDWKAIDLRRS